MADASQMNELSLASLIHSLRGLGRLVAYAAPLERYGRPAGDIIFAKVMRSIIEQKGLRADASTNT
ncbi:hypothetical protein BHE17_15715 [Planococcus maritimus]|nr:hypothetical protein BHE17_15715 [Planococcus maritimus]